jgi:DNA invertase Pin-like site-specific DNA recombinase
MAWAIGLRDDYSSSDLRGLARRCVDADQVRRLLALAVIRDGGSRSEAAKVGGVTLQVIRDWAERAAGSGDPKDRWKSERRGFGSTLKAPTG